MKKNAGGEVQMVRYIAVLIPDDAEGSWLADLPDFTDCRARSASVDLALRTAAETAARTARSYRAQGLSLPRPRNLEQIRADEAYARHRLDWSRALVSVVNVPI